MSNDHSANGWRWETLEKIAVEGAPILYGILQPGPDLAVGVPYVRPTEIVEDIIDLASIRRTSPTIAAKYKRSVLKPNDIILSIVGTIGKVALVPNDLDGGNITQSSVRIRVRPEIASSRYIAWALRSPLLTRQFDEYRLGTAVPRLNVAHVRSLRVPIPSLDEQREIVAEIEKQFTRLEAGVAGLRRVQANLKCYRAAVLKAACEGKLVPTEAELAHQDGRTYETGAQLLDRILSERREKWSGKGKYKEPSPIEPGVSPEIPDGWVLASAEAVCSSVRDGTHDTPGYVNDGVPLITSKNLMPSGLDFETAKLISRKDHAEIGKRSAVEYGDVLFAMIGTVGNPIVVETDREFSIKNVGLFKANSKFILPRYLRYWLMSPQFRQWLEPKQKGTTQKFVPLGLLRALIVTLPPLPEQRRIVAEVERHLSVVEELEAVVNANIRRGTRLRQSVLQRAFSGHLWLP